MTTHFEELMAKKSDEELKEYISNIDRYTPEALVAVVNELKKRGQNFSDDELRFINEKIKKKNEIEDEGDIFNDSKLLRKNVVSDPDAPLLYSRGAILGFTIIFTVLFGAILLSSNINDRKNKWKVIGFGILFTTLTTIIGLNIQKSFWYIFFIDSIAGYIMISDLWNRYIGRETKYRTKSIWVPLIISIIIATLFVLINVTNNGNKA